MKLEDYINNIKNPRKNIKTDVKYTALDIDSYNFISWEKKELVKAVFPYLADDMFMDIFERYEQENSEYAFYQSRSSGKLDLLIRVKICDVVDNYKNLRAVSREKFDAEYNRCAKTGSQKYADAKVLAYRDPDDGFHDYYMDIYYTDDGKAFVDSTVANAINKMGVNDLGKALARFCIDCEKEKGRSRVRK